MAVSVSTAGWVSCLAVGNPLFSVPAVVGGDLTESRTRGRPAGRTRGALAMLVVAGALVACVRGPSVGDGNRSDSIAADTLRGTVAIVGAEPATSVMLQDDQGAATPLQGEEATLRALAGIEVAVRGLAGGRGTFQVASVAVRAHMGVPAVDGILVRRGAGWALITAPGDTVPIAYLPEVLRGSEGARVWLAGPLDRSPDAWGTIRQ